MEHEDLRIPQSVSAHYGAILFSDTCIRDLRSFIGEHESLSLRDPLAVKEVVKVGSCVARFAPDALQTGEYERLHRYAHEAIRFLAVFDARPKLQAHLYGDAADIARTVYRRTGDARDAHETGVDYLLAAKRTMTDDYAYRLRTLCELGEFGIELLVDRSDGRFARIASEELKRFPVARVREHYGVRSRAQELLVRLHHALPH